MNVTTTLCLMFAAFAAAVGLLAAARATRVLLAALSASAKSKDGARPVPRNAALKRGKPRTSRCLAIHGDSVRQVGGAYVRGYVGKPVRTLLADDSYVARVHRDLSNMLAAKKPVGTMVQVRYAVHPDGGRIIDEHRATQPPVEVVHGPALVLHEQGLDFYKEMAGKGSFKTVTLSLWSRVPTKHTNDNINSGLGAFRRQLRRELSAVGARGFLGAVLRSRSATNDGILRRLRRDEDEAFEEASRVFRQIEREAGALKLSQLRGDELRAALYLGHNESATSVPRIPARRTTDLRPYLNNDRIEGGDTPYLMHGHTPVAMISLDNPPEPETHAAIMRDVIANAHITCRHTVVAEYIITDKRQTKNQLKSRQKWIKRMSTKAGSGRVQMDEDAERSAVEIKEVKSQLTSANVTMLQLRFYVLVYGAPARTQSELDASVRRLNQDCEMVMETIRTMPGADCAREDAEALAALYPDTLVGELNPEKSEREISELAQGLTTLAPVEGSSTGSARWHTIMQNMTGGLYGLNLYQSEKFSPVGIVLGGMGAGKTVMLARIANDILARLAHASAKGVDHNEGLATWVAVNRGRQLKFNVEDGGGVSRTLNIWYYDGLNDGVKPDDEQIALVVGDLMRLSRQQADDVIAETVIEIIVREVYEREVPYNGEGYDLHEPTHSHFLNTLKTYQFKDALMQSKANLLHGILQKYRGNHWLDAPTHPDFLADSRCDVFEIDSLDRFPPDIRASLAYRIGARLVSSVGKKVGGQLMPLVLLFPELHKYKDKYPEILQAIKKGARMGRTNYVLMLLDTHAVEDLAEIHELTANAGIIIIGKQSNDNYDRIVEWAGLSEVAAAHVGAISNVAGSHAQYVIALGSGTDREVEKVTVALSPAELWTFTTHPVERNARARVLALKPNWTVADAVTWLARNYPRGIVFEGLQWFDETMLPTDEQEHRQGQVNEYVERLLSEVERLSGENARYAERFGELPQAAAQPERRKDLRGEDSHAIN